MITQITFGACFVIRVLKAMRNLRKREFLTVFRICEEESFLALLTGIEKFKNKAIFQNCFLALSVIKIGTIL